jgi:protein-tyrosine-phosphatase/DNA-binding transcriptional ArsR family regulator
MLSALAQETRLELFRMLGAQGATGMAAGDIAASLRIPASTASFHLTAMERAGLLQATRRGRHVIYAVRHFALRELMAFLAEPMGEAVPGTREDIAAMLPAPAATGLQPAFNVLFLCTANAARSIMAEAILNRVGAGRFNAYSAGSAPARNPNPTVIARLAALGHDTSRLRSKAWDEFTGHQAPRMDFVIALCDTLDDQACPDFGHRALTCSWPLPDPAKFGGGPVEQATMLNELYASLLRRVLIFINLPFSTLDRLAVQRRMDELGDAVRA